MIWDGKKESVWALSPTTLLFGSSWDISVMVAGGISVPMFPNVSQENMLLQTRDSNLKYLFIANKVQWDKLGDSKK